MHAQEFTLTKARNISQFVIFATRKVDELVHNHVHLGFADDLDQLSQTMGTVS